MNFKAIACVAALSLISVSGKAGAQDTAAWTGAHGASAPATYLGSLDGSDYHLDLWDNQAFHLVKTSGDTVEIHAGRWYANGEIGSLILPLGDSALALEVRSAERLRLDGAPEDGNGDLVTDRLLAPAEISLPISGMFTYFADAPTIVHCATGLTYPVAQEARYLPLETAYLDNRAGPAEPLFVTLDATIAIRPPMEGAPRPTVIVDGFNRAWPGETCARAENVSGLTGIYWRIRSLGDVDLGDLDVSQEPFIVFREGEGRFNASVGCNMKMGGFSRTGSSLSVTQVASTMMACPDETLAMLDSRLDALLPTTASYEIGGRTLLLFDGEGGMIARLEAAYLP